MPDLVANDSGSFTIVVEDTVDERLDETANKKRKLDDPVVDDVWVTIHKVTLRMSDKAVLLSCELDDKIIGAAQKLLLHKFPSLNGLRCTLVQDDIGVWVNNYVQILHCRSNHWITVSTISCQPGKIKVYDSLHNDVDIATKNKLEKTFARKLQYIVPRVQKQKGTKDCGLFAVAVATNLAYGIKTFKFDQDQMRRHLCACFEASEMTIFP